MTRLYPSWRLLTEPDGSVKPDNLRRRVRTLSSLVLLTFPLLVFDLLTLERSGHRPEVVLLTMFALGTAYVLTRSRRYRAGGLLAVATLLVAPSILIFTDTNRHPGSIFLVLDLIVAGVLIAGYLYSAGTTAFVLLEMALIALAGVMALAQLQEHYWIDLVSMVFMAIILTLMYMTMRHFDRVELDLALAQLRISEQRYRAILESQEEMIVRVDPKTMTITFVNDAYCRHRQQTAEALIGQPLLATMNDFDRQQVEEQLPVLFAKGGNYDHEDLNYAADGQRRWIQWVDRPIINDAGEVVEFQSVGRDVTARHQTEEALRLTEQRYQSLLESKREVVSRWKPDQTITFVNDAYCRYLGVTADEVVGKKVYEIVDDRERPFLLNYVHQLASGANVYTHETAFYSRDGRQYWMEWSDFPLYDADGKVIEYQSFGRDVTERRRAQDALAMSEAYYRAVVEMQKEVIVRWKPDTTITFANDAYCQMHNIDREALIGQKILDRIQTPERDMVAARVAAMAAGMPPATYENRFVDGYGVERWMQWDDRPIADASGQIIEFQTVGRDLTELRRTLDELIASQIRLETTVNGVDGIIWEIDPFTVSTHFISRSIERILGYSPEQIIAEPLFWRSCIHPDDRAGVIAFADDRFQNGENYELEYRMRTADGRYIWLHDAATVVSEDGKPAIVRGVSIDVTTLKTVQAAEREQRLFAEALRDTIAASTSTLDLDEVLERVLEQIARVIPAAGRDIMLIEGDRVMVARAAGYEDFGEANTILEFKPTVQSIPNFRYMVETGKPRVVADTLRDPNWIPETKTGHWKRSYIGAPIRLHGTVIGFINVNSDRPNSFDEADAEKLATFADQVAIAIRNARLYASVRDDADRLEILVRQRTDELRLERERLQAILDGTGEGIMYAENGAIKFVNPTLLALTGYEAYELIDQSVAILRDQRPQRSERDRRVSVEDTLARGQVWRNNDALIARKDGTTFDGGLTVSAVGSPITPVQRTVTILRDISQEKALQAQRSAFVAHASHELRTPLTNMKTRLYLLRRTPDRLLEHLVVLENVTDWMQRLIEDLLDMTRYERGMVPMTLAEIDLAQLVRSAAEAQRQEAERKHLSFQVEIPDDARWLLEADAVRLRQVLINLITNAINYTPEPGTITVALTHNDAGRAMVEVRDTGVGIAPEHLQQIFQPFFRVMSDVDGTGLGLSISREIIEQHGGTITVDSTLGVGSTFTVTLPVKVLPLVSDALESR